MTRWYTEKKKEHYYKQAKKQGYRARSSFKLKQIQKKYGIISPGDTILDLGAAPGGWSQVATEVTGKEGLVISVDLERIYPIDNVIFYKGDITDAATLQWIKDTIGSREVNVVLSDMSPNISGNYSIDHAQSIFLSEHALQVVHALLTYKGNFICKVFMGESLQDFSNKIKPFFQSVKHFSPPASRKSSSEIYIICKSFKKNI
jgi:23S rRNA (uridine2552-2'-O)-methyltransferase